jgi:transcription initiation factor TFIIB
VSGAGEPEAGRDVVSLDAACPMCHATRRVRDPSGAEEHCAECGLVFDGAEIVAPAPFLREHVAVDGTGRGIGPFVAPGRSRRLLGSTLTVQRDGQGRPLNWHRRYEFQHLRRVMQRQTSRAIDGPLERSQARNAIGTGADRLGVPPLVAAEAERVFREAAIHGLFRGRTLSACVGATLYTACRRYSIPRTLGEVAKATGARRSEVGRAFKVVHRGLSETVPSVGTKAFLTRYAEELALSPRVRSTVEAMLDESKDNPEISGLSPHGLVAALIYLAAEREGERRSRAQVARVSAVTEVTLRSTSRLLERLLALRAPPAGGPT